MDPTYITQLSQNDLEALLESGEAGLQVIDVRTDEEHYHLGHIPQAMLIPLHTLPEWQSRLDKTAKTVLVCEHGVRSMDASLYLCHLGFTQVCNLTHGMAAWGAERIYPKYSS